MDMSIIPAGFGGTAPAAQAGGTGSTAFSFPAAAGGPLPYGPAHPTASPAAEQFHAAMAASVEQFSELIQQYTSGITQLATDGLAFSMERMAERASAGSARLARALLGLSP